MKALYKLLKTKSPIIWILILAFFTFSCEDFLEVDTPSYLLDGEALFHDPKTVEAAIVGIYAQLRSNILLTGEPQGLNVLMGTYTDELDYYSPYRLPEEDFNKNRILASNATVAEIWNGCYNQIYAANAILEGVTDSLYFTPEEIEHFQGEALFIRALLHFYLVNLYGEIPYITTTNYLVNKDVSRAPVNEVYLKVISDLENARLLLPELDPSGEKVRPNRIAATALLARVNLYAENWQAAADLSTIVIENTPWEPNLENVFLKESVSTIWQFKPQSDQQNTLEAQNFLFDSGPPPERALTSVFMNAFEAGDLRREFWIGEVSDGVENWYHPFKYKLRIGDIGSAEYSKVIRLAEVYLIRAEAKAKIGDLPAAKADLDIIRQRAGLNPVSATSQQEILQAILQERRVEFFTEHGHRFFDLKRTDNLDAALGVFKSGWNSTDRLLPIPEKEILLNPNMQPQNPGY